jgi:5'-nucleotidase
MKASADIRISVLFRKLDSSSKVKPDISDALAKIEQLSDKMDKQYSELGSAFRKGSTQTYFSSQITRYADVIYRNFNLNKQKRNYFCYFLRFMLQLI